MYLVTVVFLLKITNVSFHCLPAPSPSPPHFPVYPLRGCPINNLLTLLFAKFAIFKSSIRITLKSVTPDVLYIDSKV